MGKWRDKVVASRIRQECLAEREVSMGLKREGPYRSKGLKKERDMMKLVIILVILLVISLPAY
ncbi:type I toxin-antitoxin system Ibs family toxin [Enterobacteriaceae bacterium 89]|nr:type I toxin-antitoxin system Ibs family toxin [Enterobacteriaceae bacterium 89]